MKYIMGRKNMAVLVDTEVEVKQLEKVGFGVLGTAEDYNQARDKVMKAVQKAGYSQLSEISDISRVYNLQEV